MFFFFFFKQKTAYEMRISDWSSDVCSSDLERGDHDRRAHAGALRLALCNLVNRRVCGLDRRLQCQRFDAVAAVRIDAAVFQCRPLPRSEEHTSELQSLMRISYAVFCLKKKKQ